MEADLAFCDTHGGSFAAWLAMVSDSTMNIACGSRWKPLEEFRPSESYMVVGFSWLCVEQAFLKAVQNRPGSIVL